MREAARDRYLLHRAVASTGTPDRADDGDAPSLYNKALFGRAPKGAPPPAPCGALPNGVRRGGSGHGAAGGAAGGFH
jgi:hypothetical protein